MLEPVLANAWLEGTKMADRVKDSDRSLRSLPSSIDLPPARPSCLGACRTHNLFAVRDAWGDGPARHGDPVDRNPVPSKDERR